jgi:uncharacterized protein
LKDLRAFEIDIVSLKNKAYEFQFNVGNDFFAYFDSDLVQKGNCVAKVGVAKSTSMLKVSYEISGAVELVCDRSLEPFDYPLAHEHLMYFKFGDQNGDDSDDVVVISRAAQSINVGKYIFEFIGLEIPFKKLHPKFAESDEDNTNGKLVYSSVTEVENDDQDEPLTPEDQDIEASLVQLKEKFKKKNK